MATKLKKKKKKKKGIAIPFLVTILVSLIVIGIPVFKYYQQLTDKSDVEEDSNSLGTYVPKAEDSSTILFILDLDDTDGQDTFMLLRVMPVIDTFACVPIANSTLATYDNNADTVENIYLKNGVSGVRSAIESTFEVTIDRYIKLNEQSFQKICDILGGVNYYIPADVKGYNKGQMYLSSQQIQDIITHYDFNDDDRCYVVGSLITNMLSQTMGDRVAENLDNSFNALINIMDTDVTTIDYQDSQKAIEYMFNSKDYLAQYEIPTGSYNANSQFVVDDDFKQELATWFSGEILEEDDSETTDVSMNVEDVTKFEETSSDSETAVEDGSESSSGDVEDSQDSVETEEAEGF
jgi:hypothetical protein